MENLQGDPEILVNKPELRRKVISYGHRLYCGPNGGPLRHRWGSSKLYRAYYTDYRAFVTRPETVFKALSEPKDPRIYVIHADLKQFYDKVRPMTLLSAVRGIRQGRDDPLFFRLLKSLFDWKWHDDDHDTVQAYVSKHDLAGFDRIALPQGLVAAGFFANIVLLSFDEALRDAFGTEIPTGIRLVDACRYVDDLRILVALDREPDKASQGAKAKFEDRVKDDVTEWLTQVLSDTSDNLCLNREKAEIAQIGGDERVYIPQSARMRRIQRAVSGGFGVFGGEEILGKVKGLMRHQKACGAADGWQFAPVPDVPYGTVARFSANKYRTTYRSMRPLVPDEGAQAAPSNRPDPYWTREPPGKGPTRNELDEDARIFAYELAGMWICDPSNIWLLRVGLDIYPDVTLLGEVLKLLRQHTDTGDESSPTTWTAWYCLAEILRAAATETGLVPDPDSLPAPINLDSYREELGKEVKRLVGLTEEEIPWYLRQQALLFLAAWDPGSVDLDQELDHPHLSHYWALIGYLQGQGDPTKTEEFATSAVIARRCCGDRERAIRLARRGLSSDLITDLADKDPDLVLELREAAPVAVDTAALPVRVREDLCLDPRESAENTLANVVLMSHPLSPIRNELSLLEFAVRFLKCLGDLDPRPSVITPGQVIVTLGVEVLDGVKSVEAVHIARSQDDLDDSIYEPPKWCPPEELWRFQLGFLLRFVLSGRPDFTRLVRPPGWRDSEPAYSPALSHRYRRLHGLYSGQPAFGDEWLPITDWFENFLLALLRWPGCNGPKGFECVSQSINATADKIEARLKRLKRNQGRSSKALILPLSCRRPTDESDDRSLRACVVQTAFPEDKNFKASDLALNCRSVRRKHRRHLTDALDSVRSMLGLQASYTESGEGLDWLILPELAVHPNDVRAHLVPFARDNRTIILTGLTYDNMIDGQPLINSALWIIPEWSKSNGLQMTFRRQGKRHLAKLERKFNAGGKNIVTGCRPCQWVINYPWFPPGTQGDPLRLATALCYDATDIALATDLKGVADVLAIPALNRDINTFDNMAKALNYLLFQLVIVVNNGQYGGSCAYWPKKGAHVRRIFHTHGQYQTTINFIDIKHVGQFVRRRDALLPEAKQSDSELGSGWKHPPAGLQKTTENP